ncbi:hypothetical protein Mhun_2704 [Methanospirillum hungatei JF-1]|uniref:Uncharacterized protein n=1 Tax=Methanospirillum hungatei JF-1 (strain ATCC 27890 / DSM 864 / NBRC 100397 / JF-1) TaxID=323259 RepID=Q2FSL6_METHJ|nr:hypothetical protein Mhun_2704 [Methanospirillum hungatei JF-1]
MSQEKDQILNRIKIVYSNETSGYFPSSGLGLETMPRFFTAVYGPGRSDLNFRYAWNNSLAAFIVNTTTFRRVSPYNLVQIPSMA